MAEEVDIVVVGAGISGLCFAKFFLEIHPETSLVVVDADSHLGGVWSASRSFDSFWTQLPPELSGFSDPPFSLPDGAANKNGLYPAKYLTEYLEHFCDYHVFADRPLRDRIRMQRYVTSVDRIESKDDRQSFPWRVSCNLADDSNEVFHAKKLAIATGHSSIPNYPQLPSRAVLQSPVIHHKDFGTFARSDNRAYYAPDSQYQHIVVLGAGKSAADLAYDAVKVGRKTRVSWILRSSDSEGPPIFFPAPVPGGRIPPATRFGQLFTPSSFPSLFHPIVRLIHSTPWGRSYSGKMRAGLSGMCVAIPQYDDRPGALPGFEKLRPKHTMPFWYMAPLGMTQHEDFWDVISQNVHVYRADVTGLTTDSLLLNDGTEVKADVLLCGTGWKAEYPFLSMETSYKLGLVKDPTQDDEAEQKVWTDLLAKADASVLSWFPVLRDPPPGFRPPPPPRMCRLYNLIAPLSDLDRDTGRSVVFLGHCDVGNSFRTAEAQAIWATAYLDGNLELPSEAKAREDVAWLNAFSRRRYPSKGYKGDCIFSETVWYCDKLMADLGFTSHTDKLSWREYYMEVAAATDFKDVPAEYRRKFGIA